jgi:hypothetical protein
MRLLTTLSGIIFQCFGQNCGSANFAAKLPSLHFRLRDQRDALVSAACQRGCFVQNAIFHRQKIFWKIALGSNQVVTKIASLTSASTWPPVRSVLASRFKSALPSHRKVILPAPRRFAWLFPACPAGSHICGGCGGLGRGLPPWFPPRLDNQTRAGWRRPAHISYAADKSNGKSRRICPRVPNSSMRMQMRQNV